MKPCVMRETSMNKLSMDSSEEAVNLLQKCHNLKQMSALENVLHKNRQLKSIPRVGMLKYFILIA